MIAGIVFVAFQVMGTAAGQPFAAYDVHSYWLAGGSEHPYADTIASGFDDSVNLYKYRYPPPLAQVFVVLHLLPFPLVAGLWIGMLYAIALVARRALGAVRAALPADASRSCISATSTCSSRSRSCSGSAGRGRGRSCS